MKQLLSLPKSSSALFTAGAVFVSRLGALPANISPLGSYGFFGQPLLFMVNIVAFDMFIKGTYPGFWLTYLGFACYPVLGKLAGQSERKQLFLLPLASTLFFVLSNAGVWWYWYDHTWVDLFRCYIVAWPFFGRTLLSDVAFGYSYLILKHHKRAILTTVTPSDTTSYAR